VDFIFKQIQISQRQDIKWLSQGLSTDFIVININVPEVLFTLQDFYQIICSIVVNLII